MIARKLDLDKDEFGLVTINDKEIPSDYYTDQSKNVSELHNKNGDL